MLFRQNQNFFRNERYCRDINAAWHVIREIFTFPVFCYEHFWIGYKLGCTTVVYVQLLKLTFARLFLPFKLNKVNILPSNSTSSEKSQERAEMEKSRHIYKQAVLTCWVSSTVSDWHHVAFVRNLSETTKSSPIGTGGDAAFNLRISEIHRPSCGILIFCSSEVRTKNFRHRF